MRYLFCLFMVLCLVGCRTKKVIESQSLDVSRYEYDSLRGEMVWMEIDSMLVVYGYGDSDGDGILLRTVNGSTPFDKLRNQGSATDGSAGSPTDGGVLRTVMVYGARIGGMRFEDVRMAEVDSVEEVKRNVDVNEKGNGNKYKWLLLGTVFIFVIVIVCLFRFLLL